MNNCPNCEGDLVDGLCTCGHDGNREDCGCEYCQELATADLGIVAWNGTEWVEMEPPTEDGGCLTPNPSQISFANIAKWIDIEEAMRKAITESFWLTALPFPEDER